MDQMKQAFGAFADPSALKLPSTTVTRPDRIKQTIEGLRVNTHYKVLVVGQRGDNFPKPYKEHPQIILWDSNRIVAANIPVAVKLVLVTRFVGHPDYRALREECDRRGTTFGIKAYDTGEVKVILEPLMTRMNGTAVASPEPAPVPTKVAAPPPPKAAPAAPPLLTRFPKGRLQAFVAEYADLAKKPYAAEADRLQELARLRGYTTTADSIEQAMYLLRREAARTAPPPPATPKAAPPPMAIPPAPPSALSDDDAEILRMLDDATRQLRDVAATVDLLRQEVQQRAEKRRKLKELLAGL